MEKMSSWEIGAWIVSTIGGLQLGVQGAFNYDVIGSILGATSIATRVLYVLIGISAIAGLWCMVEHIKKYK